MRHGYDSQLAQEEGSGSCVPNFVDMDLELPWPPSLLMMDVNQEHGSCQMALLTVVAQAYHTESCNHHRAP